MPERSSDLHNRKRNSYYIVDFAAIAKGSDFDEFVLKARTKVSQKAAIGKYNTLDRVSDLSRGRFSVETAEQVEAVYEKLLATYGDNVVEDIATRSGYPRRHVVILDPETGLKHEWQIGTRATDVFLETPFPGSLYPATNDPLLVGFKENFHDAKYKLLDRINNLDDRTVVDSFRQKYGLDVLDRDYNDLLMATGKSTPADFTLRMEELRARMRAIMDRIWRDPTDFALLSRAVKGTR